MKNAMKDIRSKIIVCCHKDDVKAMKVVRIGNYDFIVRNKPLIRYYYGTRNLKAIVKGLFSGFTMKMTGTQIPG